ncbi:TonB family protein [Pseudomonas sp. 25 R 14]|uniref:TonB family protein n=1 Tax=Pseudomonas sp. 25 R 14 TaxID=1844109 RepID=UPI00081C18B0|nr:TonB family protein [Pseudomonas sp. 25 R 14]
MKYSWIVIVLLLCACVSGPSPQQLAEQRLWEQQLLTHLSLYKYYPEQARLQGATGMVRAEFFVDARGNVSRQKIISYSGSELFVPAVQVLISAASPVPAPPPSMLKDNEIQIVAPFIYCLVPAICPVSPSGLPSIKE